MTPRRRRAAGGAGSAAAADQVDSRGEHGAARCDSPRLLLPLLLALHALLACATRTFFQPDEYWQSVEVAHAYVFGYGYRTWEWKWRGDAPSGGAGVSSWAALARLALSGRDGRAHALAYLSSGPLRSAVHPFLFVPLYQLLRSLGLDDTPLRTLLPRVLQGGLSALAAYYTYRLAARLATPAAARAALFSMLVSPYYLYTATRTLSNTAEASFCTIALFYWFAARYDQAQRRRRPVINRSHAKALALAAVACVIRPTNAVIWVGLFAREVLDLLVGAGAGKRRTLPSRLAATARLVGLAALIGSLALALTALLDTHVHGRPSLPFIPFVVQNIFNSISLFYGSNPAHWYLSQGLPVVLMLALPAALLGARAMWAARAPQRDVVLLVGWTVGVYSALEHKEWRFLQPLVPLLHIMVGVHLAPHFQHGRWWPGAGVGAPSKPKPKDQGRAGPAASHHARLLLLTLPLALYLVSFHCIGQASSLPRYVRAEAASGRLTSLGLLMPCHSTPWQSHFHLPQLERQAESEEDPAWFVTCEPPDASRGEDPREYKDESDYFYEDPVAFLRGMFGHDARDSPSHASSLSVRAPHAHPRRRPRPSHLAAFDALLTHGRYGAAVRDFLLGAGYTEEMRIWNSLGHDDPRRWGEIVVFVRAGAGGEGAGAGAV